MPIKSKKKQAQRRRTFWVIIILLSGALAGCWWLWRAKIADSARLNAMTVRVNHDTRKLLSGETLSLHPHDRVKILSISTNIPLNLNVRLSAKGFDVNALRYETLPLTDLLPQQDPFNRYQFVIRVKHYNQDMGEVIWVIEPYAEDWLDKADRIIDNDRRIALLERGQRLLPGNGQINRRLIDEYKALQKWEKAAKMLEAMALKKDDVETLTELLNVYRELNDTNGIVRSLKRLIRLDPNNRVSRKAYAVKLEEAQDLNGAIREYEALLAQTNEGEGLEVYKHLGYLYTKVHEYDKAIGAYLNAAKLDQKDANLHYNLSFLYEKIGQKEKADFYLDNALTLKSGDLEGRLKLAQHLMERGRYQKARAYLSEVVKRKPDSLTALLLMAQVLEKEGDKKALKTTYQKILSLKPTNDTIVYNLGALEYEEGNLKGALPHFKSYVTSHPEDVDAHGILFDIYKREKDLPSALKEAVTIVELRPGETDIYDFICDYLRQKGDYDTMIPLLQKGLRANPKETSLRKYLISAYLRTGKEDLAIRQMEELLGEKPQDIEPLIQELFERLRAKKAYDDILGIMKQAVEVYPEDANFRGYLVFAYLKTGKEHQAMEQMEEILKLRPNDLELWLQLARLREKNNNIAGAARAYQRVLEISPEHAEASEAYLRLRLKGVSGAEEE